MPDIVQLADDEADVEKQQQEHRAELVPELHIPGQQIKEHQKYADDAAVHIGKPLLEIGFQASAHISGHLTHGVQQTQDRVFAGDVQAEGGGEFVDTGLGGLQRRQGRQLQDGRHADGDGGEQGDPAKVPKELFPAAPAADLIDEKQQKYKDAGKQSDIVIGINGLEQGQGIQQEFLIPQKANHSQHHQRQKGEGIQPHNVPLKAQSPGAQAIKGTEHGNGQVIPAKYLFQEKGKERSREAQLHRYQQREKFQQEILRHKHAEQIQRRGQIIGDQPQVIHAHSHAPGIEQALAPENGPAELHKEGIVLVVHIRIQHGVFAEGLVLADQHDEQHPQAGQREGQSRIIPFEGFPLPLRQFHSDPPVLHIKV